MVGRKGRRSQWKDVARGPCSVTRGNIPGRACVLDDEEGTAMLRFILGFFLLLFVAPVVLPLLTVFLVLCLVFLPLLLVGLVLKLVFGIVLFPLKLLCLC